MPKALPSLLLSVCCPTVTVYTGLYGRQGFYFIQPLLWIGANAVQSDDKIVAVGFGRNPERAHDTFAIARYYADGALDEKALGEGGKGCHCY